MVLEPIFTSIRLLTGSAHLIWGMRGWALLILLFNLTDLRAGQIISYINESGVRVLTNGGPVQSPPMAVAPIPLPALSQRSELYLPLVRTYADRFRIDERLILAIIQVESNFDPRAVSIKNCKGLMQLHPDTARRFGVRDVFEPAQNIEGGVRFLDFLFNTFKEDLELVLAAYNAGENAVLRHGGIPPYRETRDYVQRVTSIYTAALEDADSAHEPESRSRIYRIELADGRVLFTNTPEHFAAD